MESQFLKHTITKLNNYILRIRTGKNIVRILLLSYYLHKKIAQPRTKHRRFKLTLFFFCFFFITLISTNQGYQHTTAESGNVESRNT